jgi:AcrR family transcriptional regulator
MPRQPDPSLEKRILDAAEKLLHRGGEKALSMRKVAITAGTNTPAVYRRFRNKKDILRALLGRNQDALFNTLRPCSSLLEASQLALEFALSHPREYELITSGLFSKVSDRRPNVEFLKQRSAEWLGGVPEDHTSLVIALWSLMHGTAMLLISNTITLRYAAELRVVYTAAVNTLVSQASNLTSPK